MGHVVEKVLLERQHEIVAVIDNEADWQRLDNEFRRAEVAIDFSEPSVAVSNMLRAFEAHVPVVVGTTGWLDRLEEVCKRCADANGKLVYGSNFSIGVNIFFGALFVKGTCAVTGKISPRNIAALDIPLHPL